MQLILNIFEGWHQRKLKNKSFFLPKMYNRAILDNIKLVSSVYHNYFASVYNKTRNVNCDFTSSNYVDFNVVDIRVVSVQKAFCKLNANRSLSCDNLPTIFYIWKICYFSIFIKTCAHCSYLWVKFLVVCWTPFFIFSVCKKTFLKSLSVKRCSL